MPKEGRLSSDSESGHGQMLSLVQSLWQQDELELGVGGTQPILKCPHSLFSLFLFQSPVFFVGLISLALLPSFAPAFVARLQLFSTLCSTVSLSSQYKPDESSKPSRCPDYALH